MMRMVGWRWLGSPVCPIVTLFDACSEIETYGAKLLFFASKNVKRKQFVRIYATPYK